ncbi:unnamed protein product [Allacma fusca]|uniref:F-box domain-containing protein n=1 Tax=Allacma fusca TaxID=39272 RepID=A0A8J2M6K6_9HEXA|nr:unnamed protein product [Allacma fusca]
MSRERNSEGDILELSQRKKFRSDVRTAHFSGARSTLPQHRIVDLVQKLVLTRIHTDSALSNILVLKQIFSNLSHHDLVNCCKVSKLWRSIAGPIMCHYRLTTTIPSDDIPCEVKVEKISGFPPINEKFTIDFRGLITRLDKCIHKNRMLIELNIIDRPHFQPRSDIYIPFLTAHGHRIYSLNYESLSTSVDISTYSRFLSYLPNLEILQGNELDLVRRGTGESPVRCKLRRVHFGDSANFDLWDYVLSIAPNVKEIRGFPIGFSELLSRYQKTNSIQSLVGYDPQPNSDLQRYEASLRQLADLNVKLISAAVPNFYHVTVRTNGNVVGIWSPKSELAEIVKNHFYRILSSSKDTMKELLIPPATYLDYHFPVPFVMASIETLKFEDNAAFGYIENGSPSKNAPEEEHRYFPPKTSLLVMFPNLKAIEINFSHVNQNVAAFFPWGTFGPAVLGPRIKKLKTSIVSSFGKLVKLFPHVTHLTIRSTVDHFNRVFPEICYGWPLLETLVVNIESTESFHNYLDETRYSMDSALTGIPKNVCIDLHKSIVWMTKISKEEVQDYQRQYPSLRSLTCLRRLMIKVEESALRCKLCGNDHLQIVLRPAFKMKSLNEFGATQWKRLCQTHGYFMMSGNGNSNLNLTKNDSDSETRSQGAALSNFLVLKQIFTHLSYKDLKSCCEINEFWKSTANPMMCYYGITTRDRRPNSITCTVDKVVGYDGATERFTVCSHELVKRLTNEKLPISIELQIFEHQPYLDNYIPFLSKFGHRVHEFRYTSLETSVDVRRFARFLSYMPNLEIVRSNKLKLVGSRTNSIRTLAATPVLHNLRVIDFNEFVNFKPWGFILFLAPNVTELQGFPIGLSAWLYQFINIHSEKVKTLSGFNIQPEENMNRFRTALRALAEADMKLTEATVPNFFFVTGRLTGGAIVPWDPSSELARDIKRHVWSIFESCKDTAKTLSIPPVSYMDYYFPLPFQMDSVETLIFEDNAAFTYVVGNNESRTRDPPEEQHRYFPQGTDLKAMFPNLSGLEINFSHLNHYVSAFFPRDTFGSTMLGSSIKKLKTSILSSYKQLARLFPNVTHLEIESAVDHFGSVFPEISKGWPELESIVMIIRESEGFHKYPDEAYYSLDSVLTGIPANVCAYLHRTIIWEKKITNSQVGKYQEENVSLLNMKNLKRLEFIAEDSALRCSVCNSNHLQSMITPLAVKYAFKPLENLKSSVTMGRSVEFF